MLKLEAEGAAEGTPPAPDWDKAVTVAEETMKTANGLVKTELSCFEEMKQNLLGLLQVHADDRDSPFVALARVRVAAEERAKAKAPTKADEPNGATTGHASTSQGLPKVRSPTKPGAGSSAGPPRAARARREGSRVL